jgi:hypothetical protein
MPTASNQQVQQYADQRVRPRSEQIRALYLACKDDKAAIDDVYAALTQLSPTWVDARTDAPAHLLTPADVLAWNAFITGLIAHVEGTFPDLATANAAAGQYPVVLKACVRSVSQ